MLDWPLPNQTQQGRGQYTKVCRFLPTCSSCPNLSFCISTNENEKLRRISMEKDGLGLVPIARGTRSWWDDIYKLYRNQMKAVDEEEDENLVIIWLVGKMLNRAEENGTTITVVGMGGFKKTILAKMVYNNSDIKETFQKTHVGLCTREAKSVNDNRPGNLHLEKISN